MLTWIRRVIWSNGFSSNSRFHILLLIFSFFRTLLSHSASGIPATYLISHLAPCNDTSRSSLDFSRLACYELRRFLGCFLSFVKFLHVPLTETVILKALLQTNIFWIGLPFVHHGKANSRENAFAARVYVMLFADTHCTCTRVACYRWNLPTRANGLCRLVRTMCWMRGGRHTALRCWPQRKALQCYHVTSHPTTSTLSPGLARRKPPSMRLDIEWISPVPFFLSCWCFIV